MTTRKSKYDLEPYGLVKVPKNMVLLLRERYAEQWSEKVRDIVADFLIKPEMTDAYVEPEV